jgi:hypothetical protein
MLIDIVDCIHQINYAQQHGEIAVQASSTHLYKTTKFISELTFSETVGISGMRPVAGFSGQADKIG